MKVYLIDNEHVSHNTADEEPYVVMDLDDSKVKDGDVTLDLKIPGNAAFYIEADDGKGIAETDEKSNLHDHIVRKDYYYEERADLMPYTDIYENSFDVSLGMLGHAEGADGAFGDDGGDERVCRARSRLECLGRTRVRGSE